ncbi:hypothetical protein L596_023985 [Steinernema carpocapsae]|uniref:PAT complex subunit CCDC47 n=1 Tax=Steinernema carpocapsae TaxID=34508 RepID=A0A4U5MFC9_STECR|nr:hypothetical protein L596_023985 [Steinernema carpocapsae]
MTGSPLRALFLLLLIAGCALILHAATVDDIDEANEFAEFEDAEEVKVSQAQNDFKEAAPASQDNADDMFEADKAEFEDDEHLQDEDQFENVPEKPLQEEDDKPKKLQFTNLPSHLRSNWSSYQVEVLIIFFLVLYMLNYLYGKNLNQTIATRWFDENRPILEKQFAIVGDDGVSQEPESGHLVKETDNQYSIWCSGREGCRGLHIQIQLKKRQDLLSYIFNLIRPRTDRVYMKLDLEKNEMDTFVLAFGQKKSATKIAKEMADLSLYTVEMKSHTRFGLPAEMTVYGEIAESLAAISSPGQIQLFKKYLSWVDYFHISDQFTGAKLPEGEVYTTMPPAENVVIFSMNLMEVADLDEEAEAQGSLLNLFFHTVEVLRKYRLSKEGKRKADKKRQQVEENFLKVTHQQRMEAAQARREEKTRERKQRLMEEEDPEKQRRLEKQEQKREAKMRQPRMKQLKVK